MLLKTLARPGSIAQSVACLTCRSRGRKFESQLDGMNFFEIDCERISTVTNPSTDSRSQLLAGVCAQSSGLPLRGLSLARSTIITLNTGKARSL